MVRNPKSEEKKWQTLKIEDLTFDLSVVTQRESKRWGKIKTLVWNCWWMWGWVIWEIEYAWGLDMVVTAS